MAEAGRFKHIISPKKAPAAHAARGAVTFFAEREQYQTRWPAIIAGLGVLIFLLILIATYLSTVSRFHRVEDIHQECVTLLDNHQYEAAEQRCTEALDLLRSTSFISNDIQQALGQEIKQLLYSDRLLLGLAGETIVDGRYLTESTRDRLIRFRTLLRNGDLALSNQKWGEATDNYAQAMTISSTLDLIQPDILAALKDKQHLSGFQQSVSAGQDALDRRDWQQANQAFKAALTLSNGQTNNQSPSIQDLKQLVRLSQYNHLRWQGQEQYDSQNWTAAILLLEQGVDESSNESERIELTELLTRARLYGAIDRAQKAVSQSQWDLAISEYEQAAQMLEDGREQLGLSQQAAESRTKLARLKLYTQIIKERRAATAHFQAQDKDAAITVLSRVLTIITEHPLAQEEEFQKQRQEIEELIEKTRTEMMVSRQIAYLTDNYQRLFISNNPDLLPASLSRPQATFLKKQGRQLLFQLQCTEQNYTGRPVRLLLNYLYDPTSDRWSFSR